MRPFLDSWLKSHGVDPQSNLPAQSEVYARSNYTQRRFTVTSAAAEIAPPVPQGMRVALVVGNTGPDRAYIVIEAPNGVTDATSGIPLEAGDKLTFQLPFTVNGRIVSGCDPTKTATLTVLEGTLSNT